MRLGLPFVTAAPTIDETPLAGELPRDLAMRLARAKASAMAPSYPDALIIGSDQVACIGNEILGKPGSRANAITQLERTQGRRLRFLTGLCLLAGTTGSHQCCCEPYDVCFRRLSRAQIEAYVDREQPFDCAGSFKAEGLGIALFESLQGADPNALIGLPMIRLVGMLAAAGVDVLTAATKSRP